MAIVVLAGTLDTKGGEYAFVRDKILSLNSVSKVVLVNVGVLPATNSTLEADINSSEVVAATGLTYEELRRLSKSDALQRMSDGLGQILVDLYNKGELHGVMGMGGGCGSTLLAPAFRKLPIGVPKLLISSTIACVHGRPFFDFNDMTIMYSVTDFIGEINMINKQIISNGAVAIASMAIDYFNNQAQHFKINETNTQITKKKPIIAVTLMGATQKGLTIAIELLDKLGYEIVTFSPNGITLFELNKEQKKKRYCLVCLGSGSAAMDHLVKAGLFDGVLDATIFDIMNTVVPDNIWDSTSDRLEAAGRKGIPQVVSLGGLDILTFGPWSKCPLQYRNRAKFENNANFATVRTSPDECTRLGEVIAKKLNGSQAPVTLLVPRGGLSALSGPGGPLYDVKADQCLFEALRNNIDPKVVQLIERDENINDPKFAQALADAVHNQLKHQLSITQ